MSAVLDAGALVAVDKGDRRVGAMLRVLQRGGVSVTTSGGVVAQVWRDGSRQANLARILSGVDVDALDDVTAHRVGELLRQNRSDDLVDAHVALLVHPDDHVFTSDEPDIKALLRARKVRANIIRV
ncbi:MAG: PIN domain nuclease [Actinomycetota bacterium]|nr:PIN domain nuclease [Actinomycetota bacterium]